MAGEDVAQAGGPIAYVDKHGAGSRGVRSSPLELLLVMGDLEEVLLAAAVLFRGKHGTAAKERLTADRRGILSPVLIILTILVFVPV